MTPTSSPTVTLRPITDVDREFLFALYASTRDQELAQVPWDDATKHAFLSQQFEAQHHAYTTNYPGATLDVVEVDGRAAGRLYVHRRADVIGVIDIAFLPDCRGQGIGTALLRDVLAEASEAGVPAELYVERFNPAQALYRRLGFRVVDEGDVYLRMRATTEAADVS